MSEALRAQLDASIGQLRAVIRRGEALRRDSAPNGASDPELRIWQNDCAALVNELSGGSKAHWLSRAYSESLLVRAGDGGAVVSANPREIVARVVDVLERAVHALSAPDAIARIGAEAQPQPRRFEFVHNVELRPVLEEALTESTRALESGDHERALQTTCGIIEAIITDALSARLKARYENSSDRRATAFADRSFDERIAAAEEAGLIRNGCARLTPAARAYRDVPFVHTVTERDARVAAQVLRVVMRDLNPSR